MRKCLRCNSEMIENIEIRTNEAIGISVGEKGIFKGSLGKLNASVCPECGYTETYLANTKKLEKLIK
ncbi:MAG: nucleic acid-binding protein [Clostridia bacterium]|nr:nucleic acid-binding protein [Clostridia bacterium]